MLKNHCEQKYDGSSSVRISVDITKIVKYICCAGVFIVGIIYGTRCFQDMIKAGLVKCE